MNTMTATPTNSQSTLPASGLAGVRIAVTHTGEEAHDQQEIYQALGAEVFAYPSVQILPFEQTNDLDAALRDAAGGKYDWLVLNDADTALVVAERISTLGLVTEHFPRKLKVATIGCMTEIYTREFMKLEAAFAPEVYAPEYVAGAMNLKAGDRVLLPQSAMTRLNLARSLRATGAEVTAINAYRTIIGKGGAPVPVLLWEGKIDAITFTFPTAVRYFAKRLEYEGGTLSMLDDVCIACIGPITAATAKEYGLHVDVVPQQHTIEGLAAALVNYFGRKV